MPLTPSSFVVPKLDEHGEIAPRQRLVPGMLAIMLHNRGTTHPTDAPRGSYFVRLVQPHSDHAGYWVVRVIAPDTVYGGSTNYRLYGRACTTSTRSMMRVHPDPEHGSNTARERRMENMYAFARVAVKQAAITRLAERLRSWTPEYSSNPHKRKLMSDFRYFATRRPSAERSFIEGRDALRTRNRACGKALGKAITVKDWVGALRAASDARMDPERRAALVARVRAMALEAGHRQCDCGHWQEASITPLELHMGSSLTTMCAQCESDMRARGVLVRARTQDGEVWVNSHAMAVYDWGDGSKRTYQEPPLIGGYHSSQSYGLFVAPFALPGGHPHTGLSAGLELEFVWAPGRTRADNSVVTQMYADLAAVLPGHSKDSGRNRYCAFERDGSVDFEMVTGFGGLATHRVALEGMFRKNPYAKELRSHDGGRCGIHVHLDKPKSLIHAMKLTQFWHAASNEALIKAIARRYDAGGRYAKVCPDKMKSAREQKQLYQRALCNYPSRQRILGAAISRINADRYELLNFHNERTVEIRAFRGSMRCDTIIACLEFAYMTWFFCRDTPAHRLSAQEFLSYIGREEWRGETKYIRKYLIDKGFSVWMPKAPKIPLRPALKFEDIAEAHIDNDSTELAA